MEESSYCACLNKYDTTGLMIKMDALLKRTAGDHWDEKHQVVSFLNGAKESGGDFGEFSDPEVFAAFQNLGVSCRDEISDDALKLKMADFMQWIVKENGIELLRIDDKLRELFTPVELNSCEVKHTIVGIFISMMQVSGVEVSIPKNTLSDDSAIDQRPTVSIKMENGAPAFFVEDEPFKGIDLENQTIDRELLREAIKPYLNANEKDIVELKAGSDVPYAWPAQVIEVVKENGWSVVLLYRTE